MKTSTKLLIGLGGVTLATPLGMLAKGAAWGEWASRVLAGRLGFVPAGLARLEGVWHAALPGYSLQGTGDRARDFWGYLFSAAVGVLLTGAVVFVVGKWLSRGVSRGGTHGS